MHTNIKPKILFPSDFSESSMNAWSTCEAFAKAYDAEVILLSVVEPPLIRYDYEEEPDVIIARKEANDKIASLEMNKHVSVTPLIKVGKPFKKVIEAALEINPLMIVMGTHGASGIEEFFIGSNASRVIRSASCPVVTVRNNTHDGNFNNILLPLDVSKETKEKVAKAIELAQNFHAHLHLLSVMSNDSKDQTDYLKAQLDGVATYIRNHNIEVSTNFIESSDDISTTVLNYAKETHADFICIMTQQEKQLKDYFVGSVAESVVNHSPIPVLSIRPSNLYVSKRQGSIFG